MRAYPPSRVFPPRLTGRRTCRLARRLRVSCEDALVIPTCWGRHSPGPSSMSRVALARPIRTITPYVWPIWRVMRLRTLAITGLLDL